MKRKYLVSKVPNAKEAAYNLSGPFIVHARNPLHAARLVRHNWPSYLCNHVRVETNALSVREYENPASAAFISDRRGQVLPSVARHF
jgi:hypothetical protein